MLRLFVEYLVCGTCNVLSLSSIIQIPGVDGTVLVMKIRGRRAKGMELRTTIVKQSDFLGRTTSFYQLRNVCFSSIVRRIETYRLRYYFLPCEILP